ncbi:MAG: A/G-specific adenine glycosylase, partial [Minisyncoccia bacterium]
MKEVRNFQKIVLDDWQKDGRHNLPWRHADAYGVLVSEIMLQQTQVERVVPYFERWMKKFPTVQKLAKASLSDVLKEWSGLGYNRRAKLLRECAKEIV